MTKTLYALLFDQLESYLHGNYFAEEFDYVYDSILDAKERHCGRNPMASEYTDRMNKKRTALGVTRLGSNGMPTDYSSAKKCSEWAYWILHNYWCEVGKILALSLYDSDPMNTGCKENFADDEYDLVAYQIVEDGKSAEYPKSLRHNLSKSFSTNGRSSPQLENSITDSVRFITKFIAQFFYYHPDFLVNLQSERAEDLIEELEDTRELVTLNKKTDLSTKLIKTNLDLLEKEITRRKL